MVIYIKVNGWMIKEMDKENSNGLMEMNIKDHG